LMEPLSVTIRKYRMAVASIMPLPLSACPEKLVLQRLPKPLAGAD
jgi:hypothetical protein